RILAHHTAFMALAYVAGFVILIVPSGLGVREYLLTLVLVSELEQLSSAPAGETRAIAVLTVLLLRLTWTIAELAVVAVVFRLPSPAGTSTTSASPANLAESVNGLGSLYEQQDARDGEYRSKR